MIGPLIPTHESSQFASLYALGLFNIPAEERFDRIIRIALRLFHLPMAAITLLDANHQWVQVCYGLPTHDPSRSTWLCDYATASDAILVIPDTLRDIRFFNHPLVVEDPHVRFYVGQPVHGAEGQLVGTFCMMDTQPREFSAEDIYLLSDLVQWVEHELQATQLRQAVELLGESELRYRSLLAVIQEGIVAQDANGTIQTVNTNTERMLGLSAADLIGRRLVDLGLITVQENGNPFPYEQFPSMLALRTGKPCNNVVMGLQRPDGTLTWISINTQPMFQANAQTPHAVVSTFVDITKQKQTVAALRETEVRFRTLVEQLPVITYIAALDEHSSTIYTSPQIETMLGFTQSEWMADHQLWRKQIYSEDLPRVMEDIERSHATGSPVPSEYRMVTRTGEVKWFRDEAVIVKDDADQPLFLQGIMFDITEPKKSEEALRRSETRNRALINALPDLIIRLDKAGFCLDYKAENIDELGLLSGELQGKTLTDVLPDHIASAFNECIDLAFATNVAQVVEYQLTINKSLQEFEARIVMCGEDEVLAIVRNITERKHMERMKNEFVSTVSHELRTPLTSIRGSLGLISGGIAGYIPPNVQRMVDIACKNSDRLLRLINDILDIEKIASGKLSFHFQPLPLLPVVEQAVEANRAYGQQFNVTFALEDTTHDLWVNIDSDRLIQALTNLLSNAAKFSPTNDTVTVRVNQVGDHVRVLVSDHGSGVPESFRAQMFEKFAQADSSNTREKGGTGLGLSITRAIMEKMGGQVDCSEDQQYGTTFWVELPIWYVRTTEQISENERPRVLVCKPDSTSTKLLDLLLAECNFASELTHTHQHVQQLLQTHSYQALILDATDPAVLALVDTLRTQETTRQLPIVLMADWLDARSNKMHPAMLRLVQWLAKSKQQQSTHAPDQELKLKLRILHVEGDSAQHPVAVAKLGIMANITQVSSLPIARRLVQHEPFDLVLLDLIVSDGCGLELLHNLHTTRLLPPIVAFSLEELRPDILPTVATMFKQTHTLEEYPIETHIRSE